MDYHVLSLFEITNLKVLNGHYRVFEVQGLSGNYEEDERPEKSLNLLAKRIAFEEKKKKPVAIVQREGIFYIAIPYEEELETLKYSLAPDVITLVPLEERYEIDFRRLSSETRNLALSFLRFSIEGPLFNDKDLWRYGMSSFFLRRPINWRNDDRETDIYGGFGFRLVPIDTKIYLAVRLSYKYIDTRWLTDRYSREEINKLRMRYFLYHFGHKWYPIQLLGITGKSIAEQEFSLDEGGPIHKVYGYTLKKSGANPPNWITALDKSSPAINYRYPGNQKKRYGAATLCKLIHKTDEANVKRLHTVSIKPPHKRFPQLCQIVERYFQNSKFNGVPISITTDPLKVKPKIFPVPDLKFGNGKVLKVREKGVSGGIPIQDVGKERLACLLDQGFCLSEIYRQKLLPNIFHDGQGNLETGMDKIDRIKEYIGNPVHPVYPCLNFARVKINVHLQTKKGYKQNSCRSECRCIH